jgi:hypothetical protein
MTDPMVSASKQMVEKVADCDGILNELIKHLRTLGMSLQVAAIEDLREEYAGLCHDYDRLADRENEQLQEVQKMRASHAELVKALTAIERIAEKNSGVSAARTLQTAMLAIAQSSRAVLDNE